MRRIARVICCLVSVLPCAARAQASGLSIDRIFRVPEFTSAPMPSVHWLRDGRSFLDTRPNMGGGSDIVRVDLATGNVTVIADAARLVDESGKRLDVEDIQLSNDESKALLFHNSVRVWRTNTRGVYHVLDLRTRTVVPIAHIVTQSASASQDTDTMPGNYLGKQPSFLAPGVRTKLQMFAKFSPDGRKVAFVRDNNLFVTDLSSGSETQLTTDGGVDIVNGTTDWVYEEELGLKDAFRWSPDSRRLAYWQFDQSQVPAFPMIDEAGAYPSVSVLRYPIAGAPNSRVKVGVLDVANPLSTRWIDVGADTGIYLARMEWVGSDSLIVQRLPRKQNSVDVLMASASTGGTRVVLTDRDSAYVDVEDESLRWVNGGRQFLWRSDRTGWRQIFLYGRDGRLVRQLTKDGMDVLGVIGVDSVRGDVYVEAAGPTPTQRQVWRYSLDGKRSARVTQASGTHALDIGPGARYAVDTWSSIGVPPTAAVYELPAMRQVRVLEANTALKARLAALDVRAPQFLKVPMPDGTQLDAYRIVPASFDSTKKYPVLMFVYGGPASPKVNDAWGGRDYVWHQLLAQHGYTVVCVDNRGAAWRGRDFRKVTQYALGLHESQDQIDAAKWLGAQSWVDAGRIGIWGWSYGGYMTTMTLGRGGDLFKAGMAVAPVTDWRLYDTIYTERYMSTPQDNAEGYTKSAPQSYVDGIRARLLLVHGTSDDNVHTQNTIQYINKLEAAGKPFYMILYPNLTHSISGGNSQAHLFESLTRFVMENL